MAEANKKQNWFSRTWARLKKYLRDVKGELKKIVWPTKKQMVNNTLVVILCVFVVGVFIWLFDAVAGNGIRALIGLFG